ncbi:uncharacterized protein T551_02499 [Pneumocystis jirovecii RU7]|uniref:U4/U6.U5 small nuclear ribonucleoprotein 27kDa protein domain-containing protein n=1 Tax=Pneumocystis jirovecii (strain RU7) TaxID=1408657 RepID=A0A0W4ZJW2_PNEJ7|nr:uncharacterized protein T551_02499 [Pneumocystis jirovecii RU7]KTW28649.1 hypothetical protein T551_02499 [Pneumocystis jirovecii RU7]
MTQKYSSKDRKRSSSRHRNRSKSPDYSEKRHRSRDRSQRSEKRKSRERYSDSRRRRNDTSSRFGRRSHARHRSDSSISTDRRSESPSQTYRKNTHYSASRDDSAFLKPDTEASKDSWIDDIDRQTSQMAKMLGFSGFKTTHQQKVEGNDVGAVYKVKPTKYRQYMNRRGGFNRPLDTDTPRR